MDERRLAYAHLVLQATPVGALLANQHWALIHDAIHGHLPRWLGWALSALFGSPFEKLQYFHLKHHKENRVRERIDELPWYLYWPQLFGGLYVLELLLCLTSLSGLAVLAVQGTLLWLWGYWYLAALVVRAVLISSCDYVYHYGGSVDARQGYDLDAGPLNRYLLGFNLHGAHHRAPGVPTSQLRVTDYQGRLWPALLAQLKGPLTMFTLKTRLRRPGRDSLYTWSDKSPQYVAALQLALLGVLQATQQTVAQAAAGVSSAPERGDIDVSMEVTVELHGMPYFSLVASYNGLSASEDAGLMAALNTAVRPFKDEADKKK